MSVPRELKNRLVPILLAVLLAQTAGGDARADLRTATRTLQTSDGGTDHEEVAAALDSLRALGANAAPAAETVSGLLAHQSKLYADRDKALVARLRAYAVVTLSDIGYPSTAFPILFDTLAHPDERGAPVEVGAAAHAAGTLGPRGRPFLPYLVEILTLERFGVEEFSLARYDPLFPAVEATTVQLEAIRSLSLIATAADVDVSSALEDLTGDADPRVRSAARQAVTRIQRRRER